MKKEEVMIILFAVLILLICGGWFFNHKVKPQLKPIEKQVKVIEIIRMQHRSTYFRGDDGHTYEVNQGVYTKGDLMNCRLYEKEMDRNSCYKPEKEEE